MRFLGQQALPTGMLLGSASQTCPFCSRSPACFCGKRYSDSGRVCSFGTPEPACSAAGSAGGLRGRAHGSDAGTDQSPREGQPPGPIAWEPAGPRQLGGGEPAPQGPRLLGLGAMLRAQGLSHRGTQPRPAERLPSAQEAAALGSGASPSPPRPSLPATEEPS